MKKLFSLMVIFYIIFQLEASADEMFKIEPGWRVGPIIVTMTREDIEKVYGNGEIFVIPNPDNKASMFLLQYKQMGLDFIFKNNQLEEIDVNYPTFTVKDVIKVGSGVARVEETMGKSYIRENYKHSYEANIPDYKMIYDGIIFHLKKDRVVKITVKRKK